MQITTTFDSIEELKDFAKSFAKELAGEAVNPVAKKAPVNEVAEPEPEQAQEEPQQVPQAAPQTEQKAEPVEESAYTLEEVRAKLAKLQKAGKRAEVKEMLSSFGAAKLSEVPASKYAALMVKAGELDA